MAVTGPFHWNHSQKALSAQLGNCLEHLSAQVIPKLVKPTFQPWKLTRRCTSFHNPHSQDAHLAFPASLQLVHFWRTTWIACTLLISKMKNFLSHTWHCTKINESSEFIITQSSWKLSKFRSTINVPVGSKILIVMFHAHTSPPHSYKLVYTPVNLQTRCRCAKSCMMTSSLWWRRKACNFIFSRGESRIFFACTLNSTSGHIVARTL